MQQYDKNNIESMLEYIENLETQLDEYSTFDKDAVSKAKSHFDKSKGYKMSYGLGTSSKGYGIEKQAPSAARLKGAKGNFADLASTFDPERGDEIRAKQKDLIKRTKKKLKMYSTENVEDVESMLEYIEELETQLERYDADLDANKNGKLDSDDFKKLRDKKKKHCCSESIQEMLETVIAGDLVESKQTFRDILNAKIAAELTEAKIAIAKCLFGEEKQNDDDEEQEKEFSGHPIGQLEKISSYKPNTDEEDLEYNADGSVDKRSLNARAAKQNKPISSPKFKHANGEVSDLHPKHAQGLLDLLQSGVLKPDQNKAVQDKIHGSKEGLNKIKSALGLQE